MSQLVALADNSRKVGSRRAGTSAGPPTSQDTVGRRPTYSNAFACDGSRSFRLICNHLAKDGAHTGGQVKPLAAKVKVRQALVQGTFARTAAADGVEQQIGGQGIDPLSHFRRVAPERRGERIGELSQAAGGDERQPAMPGRVIRALDSRISKRWRTSLLPWPAP
jgi:hypothetical protein